MFKSKEVTINGVTYKSIGEAARSLGFARQTVSLAMHNNTLDNLGMGRGHSRRNKVKHNGVVYESIRQFADAFGLNVQHTQTHVCTAKRHGAKSVETKVGILEIIGK